MFRIPRSLVLQVLPLAVIVLIAAIDAGSNSDYRSDEKPFLWLSLCLLSVWLWLQWPRPRNVWLWFAATLMLILLPSFANSAIHVLNSSLSNVSRKLLDEYFQLALIAATSSVVVLFTRLCFRFRLVDRRLLIDASSEKSNAFSIFDIMAMCTAFAITTAAIRRGLTQNPNWVEWELLSLALDVSCVTVTTILILRLAAFGRWPRSLIALAVALLPLTLLLALVTSIIDEMPSVLRASDHSDWQSVVFDYVKKLTNGYFFDHVKAQFVRVLGLMALLVCFAITLRGCGVYLGTQDHLLSRFSWSRPAKAFKAAFVVLTITVLAVQTFGQAGILDDNKQLTYVEHSWPWVFTAQTSSSPASVALEKDLSLMAVLLRINLLANPASIPLETDF